MSKFLLNLPKFPKPWYIKKSNFIQKRIFPSLSTHPAFRPSRGPFFSFQSAIFLPPPPHWASTSWPAHLALSAQQTARRWHHARLPPPTRENVSPRTAFTSLRAWLTGGPHLSSPSSGAARAALRAVASSRRHGCRALPHAPLSLWPTVTTP
jgi:hypothetical protein